MRNIVPLIGVYHFAWDCGPEPALSRVPHSIAFFAIEWELSACATSGRWTARLYVTGVI